MTKSRILLCTMLTIALCASIATAAGLTESLKPGKAELKSAGALAFAPEGILLIGDSIAGAVYAIDTEDHTAAAASTVDVKGVADKVAALLGTTADQILIND